MSKRAIVTIRSEDPWGITASVETTQVFKQYPHDWEFFHRKTAEELQRQMGWNGELVGGRVRPNVWAFIVMEEEFDDD